MIKQKFIINIKDQEIELEREEARELYDELKEIFNERTVVQTTTFNEQRLPMGSGVNGQLTPDEIKNQLDPKIKNAKKQISPDLVKELEKKQHLVKR